MTTIREHFTQHLHALPEGIAESTFNALIALADDPDESVQKAIREQFVGFGQELIPYLRHHATSSLQDATKKLFASVLAYHREIELEKLLIILETEDISQPAHTHPAIFEKVLFQFSQFGFPEISALQLQEELDSLALRIHQDFTHRVAPTELDLLMSMNVIFFEEERYYGSESDYHNPNNSFLAHVMGRKTGLPITLSCLYMLLGNRVDVLVQGISMPMHFLVYHPAIERYIDVFHGGIFLSEQDCREFLERAGIRYKKTLLRPVTTHDVIARMATNIGLSYRQEDDNWGAEAAQRVLTTLSNVSNS